MNIKLRAKPRNLAHEQFPQVYPEIKQEFVYGTGIYYDGINTWLTLENPENKTHSQMQSTTVDPNTVEQYTDLHDEDYEDDNELYTGDILRIYHGGEIINVEIKKEFGLLILSSNKFPNGYIYASELLEFYGDYGWLQGILIGNIHDSPELLNI